MNAFVLLVTPVMLIVSTSMNARLENITVTTMQFVLIMMGVSSVLVNEVMKMQIQVVSHLVPSRVALNVLNRMNVWLEQQFVRRIHFAKILMLVMNASVMMVITMVMCSVMISMNVTSALTIVPPTLSAQTRLDLTRLHVIVALKHHTVQMEIIHLIQQQNQLMVSVRQMRMALESMDVSILMSAK